MLQGTSDASLLGNILAGQGVMRTDEQSITAGQDFWCCPIFQQILKYKRIIKMSLNLMVFI